MRAFVQYKGILSYLFYLFFWAHKEQAVPSDGQTEQVAGFIMNFKCRAKGKHSLYTPGSKMVIDRNKDGKKDVTKVYWFIFFPRKEGKHGIKGAVCNVFKCWKIYNN